MLDTSRAFAESDFKSKTPLKEGLLDDTNKRIDTLYLEISEIKGDLNKALSDKEIINDLIFRVQRLETKVAA